MAKRGNRMPDALAKMIESKLEVAGEYSKFAAEVELAICGLSYRYLMEVYKLGATPIYAFLTEEMGFPANRINVIMHVERNIPDNEIQREEDFILYTEIRKRFAPITVEVQSGIDVLNEVIEEKDKEIAELQASVVYWREKELRPAGMIKAISRSKK